MKSKKMMYDRNKIYALLEKHFQGKTSSEEKESIENFKKENQQEYIGLKHLWFNNSKISITNFDSKAAWLNVEKRGINSNAKFLYGYKRVAAVAVLIIVSSLVAYFMTTKTNIGNPVIEASTQFERNDSILLADGTTVWLNRNSQLIYPKKFKGKTREVELIGEAFFEVTKNPKKPFKVQTHHSTITVLGTSFNINTNEKKTNICVTTGKVNVNSQYANKNVNLLPNEVATVSPTHLEKNKNINPNYLSWKTGQFKFENSSLEEVINDLNTYYSKPIVTVNKKLSELLFTADFDHAAQEDILEILKITFNLTIQENTNFYEIY